jgi:hypothetical protein
MERIKMRKNVFCVLLFSLLFAAGCTDATVSKFTALGNEHTVIQYSGGREVNRWTSTGKVQSEEASDGYLFRDKATGSLVRVSGDVVVISE